MDRSGRFEITVERGRGQRAADLVGDGLEGGFVGGHGGQDLAVQLDAGLAQAVDELAVGEAFQTGGGVDALDPQGAEIALLGAAVAVGVLPGAVDRGLGGADGVLAAAVEALGLLENLLVFGVGRYAPFDASHDVFPRMSLSFGPRGLAA